MPFILFHWNSFFFFNQLKQPHASASKLLTSCFTCWSSYWASPSLTITHICSHTYMSSSLCTHFSCIMFSVWQSFLANASHFSCCFVLFSLCRQPNNLKCAVWHSNTFFFLYISNTAFILSRIQTCDCDEAFILNIFCSRCKIHTVKKETVYHLYCSLVELLLCGIFHGNLCYIFYVYFWI